ncbi:hypothetical protein BDK51DRAFT_46506 [Blyttiomyces helicus]|uniref:Ketopantoate reductase N-terminal domain-containing protein n=1 Tax=Blyttiomyces helicus TaxID=388810 RepID=A0A4P9VUE5_9FUNG|nr:hypothetical protein BDK51DRAFT_46506 [Blyttiomyces helicus]|eukprot:RKO83211.1 hypothetical protein BDK51DRAFT_46506 [Blyttiomyces helicus]
MSPTRIHILGAGAIGLLHAHHIRTALRIPTTLLLRPKAFEAFSAQNNSVTITDPAGTTTSSTHDAEPSDATPVLPPISSLLLCTKAGDAVPALIPLLPRLKQCGIVVLGNGALAVREEVVRILEAPLSPSVFFSKLTTPASLPISIMPAKTILAAATLGVAAVAAPIPGFERQPSIQHPSYTLAYNNYQTPSHNSYEKPSYQKPSHENSPSLAPTSLRSRLTTLTRIPPTAPNTGWPTACGVVVGAVCVSVHSLDLP